MNQRKSKSLRRKAKENLFNWYLSLLDDDQKPDLTPQLALQNTPTVSYWTKQHERTDDQTNQAYVSQQRHVSENTLRWFILQEKKKYARRIRSTSQAWTSLST